MQHVCRRLSKRDSPDGCLRTSSLLTDLRRPLASYKQSSPGKEENDCRPQAEQGGLNPTDASEQVPLLTELHRPQASCKQSSLGKGENDCRSQAERGRRDIHRATYTEGWRRYVDGHVVSEGNRTFIQNLLMATAARTSKEAEDDTDSSPNDELVYVRSSRETGSLDVVSQT